jgi:hypothetical protein
MSEVVGAIFYVVSRNNRDLERRFRVCFMEAKEDKLWIKYYANTDNEAPRTMLEGQCFSSGEGVAGHAWHVADTVIIPDVEKDIKRKGCFVTKTKGHDIQSMVAIPVFQPDPAGGSDDLIGVLNIDTDQKKYFRDTHAQRRELEILIRPYVRVIRLLYAVQDYRSMTSPTPAASEL